MTGDSRIPVRAPKSGGEEHLVAEPLNVRAQDLPSSTRERQATVLFADVSGSTKLYETAGDTTALEAISHCLALAARATEASGGRVVKTIGDELMGIFASADAAANAAAGMQVKIDSLPEISGTKLGMHIGFQHGPVLQRGNDIFGDTVNMAARLTAQAQRGQIITSANTAAALSPIFRSMVRELYSITVKGKAEEVALAELVWKSDLSATVLGRLQYPRRAAASGLRLKYRGQDIPRRRHNDSITIGRDAKSGLVLDHEMASRHHCTIECRQDRFVVRDHSTNGTFVTHDGEAEMVLRREELVLRRHGWITFGEPRATASDVLEFFCN